MINIINLNSLNHKEKISECIQEDHRNTDDLMMKILLAHWLIASTAMGIAHGLYLFGAIGGGLICGLAYLSKRFAGGTLYNRIIVAACFMLFSALFIQQNLGRIEMHFHVFVALAILARYKDISPQISALSTILVHHLIINYCQATEISVFGSPLTLFAYGTGLEIIFVHAIFAVAESVVLGITSYQLIRQYCDNLEKAFDNAEVIETLDKVITGKDLSSKLPESNEYAHSLNTLLKLLDSNTSLRSALNKSSVGIILTDSNLEILDCNDTVKTLFSSSENKIKELLPSLDYGHANGTSIKPLLSLSNNKPNFENLNSQKSLQVQLEDRTFIAIVNPVYNETNEKIGYIVEWQDHTDEVEIQNEISKIVVNAKNGRLSERINLDNKTGFFKILSSGINDMIEIVDENLDEIANVINAMSKGDLSKRITTDNEGKFSEVRDNVNNTLSTLDNMVTNIRDASNVISKSSNNITNGNNNLESRTEMQNASLQDTTSNVDTMTNTVQKNVSNTQEASSLSSISAEKAERGGEVVKSAINAMHEINDSSNKIADITNVIDEIAFQTNLLALNASVEAARAGEQGRGFAVVASEVRNLAQRSATAAKEIKDLIHDSVTKIETGNKLVDESGVVLNQIVEAVAKVDILMTNIASANNEQSTGINQLNNALNKLDEINQQNSSLVKETTVASIELSRQASNLNSLMEFFDADNQDQVDDNNWSEYNEKVA